MKNVIKSLTIAVALSAFAAGPASAMVSQGEVNRALNSVISGGSNVFASVNNDTVTITGYFADEGAKSRTIQAVMATNGIEKVLDFTTLSN